MVRASWEELMSVRYTEWIMLGLFATAVIYFLRLAAYVTMPPSATATCLLLTLYSFCKVSIIASRLMKLKSFHFVQGPFTVYVDKLIKLIEVLRKK